MTKRCVSGLFIEQFFPNKLCYLSITTNYILRCMCRQILQQFYGKLTFCENYFTKIFKLFSSGPYLKQWDSTPSLRPITNINRDNHHHNSIIKPGVEA